MAHIGTNPSVIDFLIASNFFFFKVINPPFRKKTTLYLIQ